MENASRALLMAATILIAVMLISLGTYLFATFGNYSKNINNNINSKTKQEFNAQFTKYEGGDPCTVYDIVTVINLAKNSNSKYEEYQNINRPGDYQNESNAYIYVTVNVNVNGERNISEVSNETELNNFINNNNQTRLGNNGNITYEKQYKCAINISNKTGLVKSIIFTPQP